MHMHKVRIDNLDHMITWNKMFCQKIFGSPWNSLFGPCYRKAWIIIYIYMSTLLYCIYCIQGRILKLVMLEALELGKGVRWVKDLQSSLEMFG